MTRAMVAVVAAAEITVSGGNDDDGGGGCDSYMEVFLTLVEEKKIWSILHSKYTTIINREKYICVPECTFLKQQNLSSPKPIFVINPLMSETLKNKFSFNV